MPWSSFENAPLGPLRCRFGNRPSAISQTDLSGVGRFLFLGLVVDRGGLAQDIEDLLLRGRLVDLFHRGEFEREAAGGAFENLASRLTLHGRVFGGAPFPDPL